MSKIFDKVLIKKPRYNKFDLSFEKKLTMKMGDLVPIVLQEVIPGDKFRISSEHLMRLAPMLAPMMHRVDAYVHYFFVPNRLVHEQWQDFITGGVDGMSSVVLPKILIDSNNQHNFTKGSLADHFGIPPIPNGITVGGNNFVSALPFRAYQLIYNEYYRDQTLSTPVNVLKTSGQLGNTEINAIMKMQKRAWQKDYFTSALPWPQRGADVMLPSEVTYNHPSRVLDSNGNPLTGALQSNAGNLNVNGGSTAHVQNVDGIEVTVNNLRKAIKLQEWLEKNARAGSRYIEQILSHFGVRSSDARLQRPEYLGGGKTPVTISEVLSTVATQENPQANMAGHGISFGNSNRFSKYFEEHGFIIGIMSVIPRAGYSQGIPKHFLKLDKFDYFWPEFAQLGEQPVYQCELFWQPDNSGDRNYYTFGYQQRYAEYKNNFDTIAGEFRDTLDFWHMNRIFANEPNLNQSFIECNPTTRVFAVEDNSDKLFVQIYNKIDALRLMPYFNVPQI